eukprot:2536799-Prymnesium_polylepis.1
MNLPLANLWPGHNITYFTLSIRLDVQRGRYRISSPKLNDFEHDSVYFSPCCCFRRQACPMRDEA